MDDVTHICCIKKGQKLDKEKMNRILQWYLWLGRALTEDEVFMCLRGDPLIMVGDELDAPLYSTDDTIHITLNAN